jgi:hypothetical protein
MCIDSNHGNCGYRALMQETAYLVIREGAVPVFRENQIAWHRLNEEFTPCAFWRANNRSTIPYEPFALRLRHFFWIVDQLEESG